jgi:hypothetical protein
MYIDEVVAVVGLDGEMTYFDPGLKMARASSG